MARYIRTDELLKTARDGHHSDFGRSMADLTSLREVIEDTPTADVVEVVRCKNCKHWGSCVYDPIFEKMYGECSRTLENFDSKAETSEDDFCSYGGLKEREKV